MYSAENILWIKNIKRHDGDYWAYDNIECGKSFFLNWSSHKSASKPAIGDIIALFQKPKKIENKKNYDVRLTHLVSPISNEIKIDPNSPKHKYIREMKIIAFANPISSIPNPGYFNFLKPNRGSTNPIINLTNNIGLTEIETKERIWNLFDKHFCSSLLDEIFIPQDTVGIYGEMEGDKIIHNHIQIELINRNSKIVQHAKSLALKEGNGKILCECCDFDFLSFYGKIGFKFIECHHKIHLSKGQRITEIKDLAMVCSNCHRMLHRKKDEQEYHNIESLSILIKSKKEYLEQ